MEKKKNGKGPHITEHAKDFKGTLKKVLHSLSEYKLKLIIVLFFAILSTIFSIVGPKILGNATTELFNGLISKLTGGIGINFPAIYKILISLLIIYIISMIFSIIQGFLMTSITQKYTYELRKKVSEKVHKLPLKYFDKKTHGEVLSLVTNDIDTIGITLNQSATSLISSAIMILGIIIMMFSINISMTLVSLLILPISIILVSSIVKKSQHHFEKQQEYLAQVNGNIEEMYSGHTLIKAYNAEEKMLENFEKNNEILCESSRISQFLSGLMHPIMHFISNLGYVIIAILGGYYCIKGKITVGNIQSFITYTKNFTRPITEVANEMSQLQTMIAASERVFEFLESEEEHFVKNSKIDTSLIKGNVEFKNVSFGYNENEIIIKNFNAKIKKGQKIAIVGPTGAGKTTIIKLLMRFYNLNEGSILIDNNNITNFKKEDLRNIFGMVLQDTWLFNGTVMDNIKYGRLNATDDEVIDAAKLAHVHHFIQTLPDGYNMKINEESTNISAGQKQLLTIARAILADPKILILDEATSSVDTRTEILIQQAMDTLMKGRTSFIIAHRLSTIKNADLILVMKDGNIVETGTHDNLMEENGFYASLYNSQFERV